MLGAGAGRGARSLVGTNYTVTLPLPPHCTHQTQLDHWGSQETQAEGQGAASSPLGVGICGGPGSGPQFLHIGNGDESLPFGAAVKVRVSARHGLAGFT